MTSQSPLVSIMVCAYNAADTLSKCVESLIVQTLSDIQIVCVDDGSTDETGRILDDYASRDGRILVIHQENAGVAAARNTGLKNVRGKYLMFCDADDWMDETMCAKMVNALIEQDVDWVSCGVNTVLASSKHAIYSIYYLNRFFGRQLNADIKNEVQCTLWNKIFKMDVIRRHQLDFPIGRIQEDNYFIILYACLTQTIYALKDKLYFHTIADVSQMGELYSNQKSDHRFDKLYVAQLLQNALLRKKLFYPNQEFFIQYLHESYLGYGKNVASADYVFFCKLTRSMLRKIDDVFLAPYPILSDIKKGRFSSPIYRLEKTKQGFDALKQGFQGKQARRGQKIIPIAFYANHSAVMPLSICIRSIVAHSNPRYFYDIYVFSKDWMPAVQLQSGLPENIQIKFMYLKSYLHAGNTRFSDMAQCSEKCYRLLIPEVLQEFPKIIYLDCDTLVRDDLSKLYDMDLQQKTIGGVVNVPADSPHDYIAARRGLDPHTYVHAGVLLIDTGRYVGQDISRRCHEVFMKMEKLTYGDQDLLNIVCENDICQLPGEWNARWPALATEKGQEPAKIMHFSGTTAPWIQVQNPASAPWWAYAKSSPYYFALLSKSFKSPCLFSPVLPKRSSKYRSVLPDGFWRMLSYVAWGSVKDRFAKRATARRQFEYVAPNYFRTVPQELGHLG